MGVLQIKLLGGFSVQLANQPISQFRSAKARALLAYLAAQPDQDHARTKLATLLWGDLPETAAKTNLRIELSGLNKLLPAHPALEIGRNDVRFCSAYATVDVSDFKEAVAAFMALSVESQGKQLLALERAIDHYQGEFLAGFQLNDAIEFEEWQLLTQEQLHEQMMLALNALHQRHAEQGNWAKLAAAAQRQLGLVPWQEAAHRNLIQALAVQGQRQAALVQYAKCCAVLQEELGVEPSLATREIAARLRDNQPVASTAQIRLVRHNLTQQLKSLVGREVEIARLHELVQTERLVTLLGIGGVGKSRLAQAVAQNAVHDFADGVWFVPLATIEATAAAPDRIALAIAAAIGFQITDMQTLLAELAAYLADQQTLLVLDNWDHLIAAAEAVCEQLLNNAAVHILATSRLRLMVADEIPVQLDGLLAKAAFALFLDRARRIVPTYATGEKEAEIAPDVFRICEQVAGLPLGIELAASWVEHFSVAEIAQSLAEIEIAPAQADRLVDRHQTLRSVFEYSWRLLSAHQQQILARLSAFRGGFDRKAATTVANSGLSDLSMLIAHSLIQRIAAGRYDLHPLMQEFAARKLSPDEMATLFRNHSHHYLPSLINTERIRRASHLLIDFENIRSAWQHAIHAADDAIVQQAAVPFGEFMTQFGLMADGERLFRTAVECFEGDSNRNELVAQLLDQQSVFLRSLQGLRGVSVLQQRVLTLTNNRALQARAHLDLANHHAEQGEWEQADFHFDRVEELAQASSALAMYIEAVESRTHINALHFRGDFAKGIARLEEMLTLLDAAPQPIDDVATIRARLWQSLSLVAIRYRDYALAIRYAQQALAWAREQTHRQKYTFILVDLALAEQFAGMYTAAIAHNQEALAIAEEIGDTDEIGLIKANLCLTLRQQGELEEALAYGVEAIESLRALGQVRIEGQARNRVGHTLLALERWADAYAAALTVWEPLQHPNHYEAVAGRTVAAFQLGRQDEAMALVNEVLDFVATEDLVGIVEPVLLLLNCEAVLTGLGRRAQARQVLAQADAWVQTISGRISDDTVRAAFLHNRPDNQVLKTRIASLA